MNNKLSVIIPTFNVEIYLEELLCCIENWADEIIICDSFSTDKTLEIARRHDVKSCSMNTSIQRNKKLDHTASYKQLGDDHRCG